MKKFFFIVSILVISLNSCVKESLLKIDSPSNKALTTQEKESLNDGLAIVKKLSSSKGIQYYQTVPEKFRSKIKSELKAKSVSLYIDTEKKFYYFIYNFSDTGTFINGLGGCGKKFVYDNLNRIECKGQGTDCDIQNNPDGSWEVIICIL